MTTTEAAIANTLDALWGDLDLSGEQCPTAGCQRVGWRSVSTPDERPLCLDCRLQRDGYSADEIASYRRAARLISQPDLDMRVALA